MREKTRRQDGAPPLMVEDLRSIVEHFPRYRGESIGESTMTAQYVSTVLKRHAESTGLDPEAYSTHSLRAGFATQAIRGGKAERHVKEHSGHSSWETFNQYVEEAGTFQDNLAEDIGL